MLLDEMEDKRAAGTIMSGAETPLFRSFFSDWEQRKHWVDPYLVKLENTQARGEIELARVLSSDEQEQEERGKPVPQ